MNLCGKKKSLRTVEQFYAIHAHTNTRKKSGFRDKNNERRKKMVEIHTCRLFVGILFGLVGFCRTKCV